jgi:hypothetical protein
MADTEETASIKKDNMGNILVDQNGYVTCISEGIIIIYLKLVFIIVNNL